jgi:hypothetical protein
MAADAPAESLEYFTLPFLYSLSGCQNLFFELLERRCDIPLCASECLPALIVSRHEVRVGIRNFDEIAEHTVVADLQGS